MADKKITELTALESLELGDLLVVVDDVSGTPVTKKITLTTLATLFAQKAGDNIGDVSGGHYTEIKSDGEILRHGTARTKNGLWIPAAGLKAPGSKPATFIEHGIDSAWSFADAIEASQESVSGTMRLPKRMDRGVAPEFCICWSANGVSPGSCEWQLEYLWTSPDEDTTAGAQETLTATGTASSTSNGLIATTVAGIDAPSATDMCLHFRVTRLSAHTNDTISDTVELLGLVLDFTSNKFGEAT
ncbi:MAG: hypothetical protein U9O78_04330 [Patescibacteria group bacterium]|nr:hypothetical protein [Patescibacteria group bacterium]